MKLSKIYNFERRIRLLHAKIMHKMRYFIYDEFLFKFNFGNRMSTFIWDEQYNNGTWDYLDGPGEKEHYEEIWNQIRKSEKSVHEILDFGCGSGTLLSYRSIANFKYVGIDFSQQAINMAQNKYHGYHFECMDLQKYQSTDIYNVIVFNETLYYFNNPIKLMNRVMCKNLENDGIVVISMCQDVKNETIWKNIESTYDVVCKSTIKNHRGQIWDVKSIRRRK
jgi:2-polyprenyl-3-methyl-5-hydroxy-6-metoxy-1,4-benzoquinol methylase